MAGRVLPARHLLLVRQALFGAGLLLLLCWMGSAGATGTSTVLRSGKWVDPDEAAASDLLGDDTMDLAESSVSAGDADVQLIQDSKKFGFTAGLTNAPDGSLESADAIAGDAILAQNKLESASDKEFTQKLEADSSVLDEDLGGTGAADASVTPPVEDLAEKPSDDDETIGYVPKDPMADKSFKETGRDGPDDEDSDRYHDPEHDDTADDSAVKEDLHMLNTEDEADESEPVGETTSDDRIQTDASLITETASEGNLRHHRHHHRQVTSMNEQAGQRKDKHHGQHRDREEHRKRRRHHRDKQGVRHGGTGGEKHHERRHSDWRPDGYDSGVQQHDHRSDASAMDEHRSPRRRHDHHHHHEHRHGEHQRHLADPRKHSAIVKGKAAAPVVADVVPKDASAEDVGVQTTSDIPIPGPPKVVPKYNPDADTSIRADRVHISIQDEAAHSELALGESKSQLQAPETDGDDAVPSLMLVDWSDHLITDYRFLRSLSAEKGNGPTLAGKVRQTSWTLDATISSAMNTGFAFRAGEGLTGYNLLDESICAPDKCAYTLMMTFMLTKTDTRRKIIDFKNGGMKDCGLYVENDKATFRYEAPVRSGGSDDGKIAVTDVTAVGATITPGIVVNLALTREDNNRVTVYVNDEVQLSWVDKTWDAVPGNGTFIFFEDKSTSAQNSAGEVGRIRLFRKFLGTRQMIAAGNIETEETALNAKDKAKEATVKDANSHMLTDFYFSDPLESSIPGSPNLIAEFGLPDAFAPVKVDGEESAVLHVHNDSCIIIPNFLENPEGAYSIVMLFSLENVQGYRKILDWNRMGHVGSETDAALYSLNGRFKFFYDGRKSISSRHTVIRNQNFHQLIIAKDEASKISVYVDGHLQMQWVDKERFSVPSSGFMRLFANDTVANIDLEDVTTERSTFQDTADAEPILINKDTFQFLTTAAMVARLRVYRRCIRKDEVDWLTRMHPHKGAHTAVHAGIVGDYWFMDPLSSGINGGDHLDAISRRDLTLGYESVSKDVGLWTNVMRVGQTAGLSLDYAMPVHRRREYSIVILFSVAKIEGIHTLFYFPDRTGVPAMDPLGLYVHDGHLEFYGNKTRELKSIESDIKPDTFYQVIFSRDSTEQVQVYVDGMKSFTFDDKEHWAMPDPKKAKISFFKDMSASRNTEGSIARIRIADNAISPQIAVIMDTAFSPDSEVVSEPLSIDGLTMSLEEEDDSSPQESPAHRHHHIRRASPAGSKVVNAKVVPAPEEDRYGEVADFEFKQSLADVSKAAFPNSLVVQCASDLSYVHSFAPFDAQSVAVWALQGQNSGKMTCDVTGKSSVPTFSVAVVVKLGAVAGLERVFSIGHKGNTGLYVMDGFLKYVGVEGSGMGTVRVVADKWTQIVLTRDEKTKRVSVFVDGEMDQTFEDTGDDLNLTGPRVLSVAVETGSLLARVVVYRRCINPLDVKDLNDSVLDVRQVQLTCGPWCLAGGGVCHNGGCVCKKGDTACKPEW